MPFSELQKLLQASCDRSLLLKLNNNRSTMLSIKWEPECTKVSLHRIFLAAPRDVTLALAKSLEKRRKSLPPVVKAFIQEKVKSLNYSSKVDASQQQGKVYNLKKIYDCLNAEYFNNDLKLNITWFDSKSGQSNQLNLGLYHDTLKLIKVNRIMDNEHFPEFFVRFVIYHEMLHEKYPAYVDKRGINRIHHPEFKQCERQFKEYALAKGWLKQNLCTLFEEESACQSAEALA